MSPSEAAPAGDRAGTMDRNIAGEAGVVRGHEVEGGAITHHRHAKRTAFLRWQRHHALPPGSECRNCAAVLQGPWCHACGQLGEDFHRSAIHLVWELLEGMFHADGRLWHTLPQLVLHPGRLTRDYLAGKRASQVPPLRIFFIVMLLLFLVGEGVADRTRERLVHVDTQDARVDDIHVNVYKPWDAALTAWTKTHVGRAIAHPDQFVGAMAGWAHDFAFLSLPIFGLILKAIFVFRRRFVLFDHLVFSMHSLSVLGLILLICMLLDNWTSGGLVLLWLVPVHQFFHLRSVYGTSIAGTLIRLGVLAMASSFAFSIVVLGLVVVAMAALQG